MVQAFASGCFDFSANYFDTFTRMRLNLVLGDISRKNRLKAFWFARNIIVGDETKGGTSFDRLSEMISLIDPDIVLEGEHVSSSTDDMLAWYNSVKKFINE